MRVALACLLLFAPGKTYELKYRFQKGLSYVDSQQRVWKQTLLEKGRSFEYHITRTTKVKRTILEVDENARPRAELVEVELYRVETHKSPKQDQLGLNKADCEGKTFLWKRLDVRWGLFDPKDAKKEVGHLHKSLVADLKNWRDARLPKKRLAVGGTWEVTPDKFLRTAGLPVPPKLQGVGQFKLESVTRGVATIPFDTRYMMRDGKTVLSVQHKGVWTFDVSRGRDLSFVAQGDVLFNEGKGGSARLTVRRTVSYSP